MTVSLIALVALLAFANGANDNSKGVATLVGFGAARPAPALVYATLATMLGGAVSFFLAGGLLKGFNGNWLFSTGVVPNAHFYIAVLIGACGWVLLASKAGMPVSTTHAIIGALTGAGLVSFGNARFQWVMLGHKFAMPLAISPLISLAAVYVITWPVLFVIGKLAGRCVCVVEESSPAAGCFATASAPGGGIAAAGRSHLAVIAGAEAQCAVQRPIATASIAAAANQLHWLCCGLISFARGWNDTPKIAALSLLGLSSIAHGTAIGFAIVSLAMAAGGLIMGRRVLDTLAKKLTPLPLAESLTASLTTATLVGLASWIALPVSTTHVATGSIIGAGLKNNSANVKWARVGEIVLSWIITLPVAAVIAAAAKLVV